MPAKKLPRRLIKRLKRVANRIVEEKLRKKDSHPISSRLERMKNIDYRSEKLGWNFATSTSGGRVRQMNVSRNYPGAELAIKRVEENENAGELIRGIQEFVREHNNTYSPKYYKLLMPHAYAISDSLVAMAKTSSPSLYEVIYEKTQRGQKVIEEILKKHKVSPEQLEAELEAAGNLVLQRTGILKHHLLLLGFEKGKFIFVPLIDWY